MDKIRFGLIGVGGQGSAYAGFLTGRGAPVGLTPPPCPACCALGALCDTDPARAVLCKEKYPDFPFFFDWKEMALSGTVDAVITTLPHYEHPEIAMWCLEQGVNVLVEKPAGVYTKAVQKMNECAALHPETAFGIMFNQRTNMLYQKIKQLIASGELGEVRRSCWIINTWWRPDSYYTQSAWRATWGGEGGGVLVNQAPHQLDLWQWMCGMPVGIYANVRYGFGRDIAVDNDVTILARYESGATGTFITCTHDACGTDRLEIDMDGGKIVVEDSRKATIYRLTQPEKTLNATMDLTQLAKLTSGNSGGGLYTTQTFESTDGWGVQHMAVIENFALHILNGTPLLAPGSDGICGVQLANAALLSAWLGREVSLPVDETLYLRELNQRIAAEGKFSTRE